MLIANVCSNEKPKNISDVKNVWNEKPKYSTEQEFIKLKKLHSIDLDEYEDYYITNFTSMDVDSDDNLYVPDYLSATITVFDKNGKYLRTMGQHGQGPGDLEFPYSISILRDTLYIYENRKGIKVWDRNGKYIDFFVKKRGNYHAIKALKDFFLSIQYRVAIGDKGEHISFHLERFNSEFEFLNEIAMINRIQDDFNFGIDNFVAVDSKKNVYFPEKEDEYIIGKYDLDGNKLLAFGREYKRKPYSDRVIERNINKFRKYKTNPHPKYPPVVRFIIIDDRDYVWVVVGEWGYDCGGEFTVTSTIDIFDSEGNFLYNFQSTYFNFPSFIKNGRLYSAPYYDDNNIHVFEIEYKK